SVLLLVVSCGGAGGDGAQGFGAATPGGDRKPAHHVTHLGDSGPGSLRDALSAGDRRVVFDVAGTISLESPVSVRGSFVTIDGASAPPPGITLRNHGIRMDGGGVHDVIVRGLRIRSPRSDGITVKNGVNRVLIHQVSVDGCGDGNVDITRGAHDVTVSWSIISGCAKNMLIKYDAGRVSLHHNVFVHSQWRNPWLSNADDGRVAAGITADVRNNVVWGWGNRGGGTGVECGAKANLVGNFYSSPNTQPNRQAMAFVFPGCDRGAGGLAYTAGNVSADRLSFDLNSLGNQPRPFPAPATGTEDACAAAATTLGGAGARPLDAVDQNHLGRISLAGCG
ncbi:MAG: hypothetical protein ACRDJM_10560, partial [Actinomycetota bacterium]